MRQANDLVILLPLPAAFRVRFKGVSPTSRAGQRITSALQTIAAGHRQLSVAVKSIAAERHIYEGWAGAKPSVMARLAGRQRPSVGSNRKASR